MKEMRNITVSDAAPHGPLREGDDSRRKLSFLEQRQPGNEEYPVWRQRRI